MRVTVIPDDQFIMVNGEALEPVPCEYDEDVHAIQWDGTRGHIEFVMPDGGITTTPVSSMEVQPYIDAWQAEKERLEAITDTPPTVEEVAAAKQEELGAAYTTFLSAIQPEYTSLERDTWAAQSQEAARILANPDLAPEEVPMLKAISDARVDVTLHQLAERVIANEKAWIAISGHVTGQRHNYQKKLDDALRAKSIEQIETIEITFSLPEGG